MATRSTRKGRGYQTKIKELLISRFGMPDGEIRCAIGAETGTDIKLTGHAKSKFPFSIECKKVEKLNIWKALKQAEANTDEGTAPLVIFSRNHADDYVALRLEDFLDLIK